MKKYRVKFTVAEEDLLALLTRLLPVQDMSVEELTPAEPPPPRAKTYVSAQTGKIYDVASARPGLNNVLIEAMSDGKEHTTKELGTVVSRNGYAKVSAQSALWKMRRTEAVVFLGNNTWKLNSSLPPNSGE